MAALNGYLALGVLSAAGVFTEISGAPAYARQAISLAPASAGSVQNASTINFPVNSGSARWPAYGAYAVYDAATGGNVLFAWNIYPGSGAIASRSPLPGRRHTIPAGTIKLEFPAVMSEAGSEVVLSKPFLWTPGGLQRFEESPVTPTGSSVSRALGDTAALVDQIASSLTGGGDVSVSNLWTGAQTTSGITVSVKLNGEALVRIVASEEPNLTSPVASASVMSSSRIAKVSLTGLSADTAYHYGVQVNGRIDPVRGKFRTLPVGPASFTLGLASCARDGALSESYDAIRARNPLFFLHMGDLHYRDITTTDEAVYQAAYDTVLSQQAQFFREIPVYYMYNDHDFCGNDSVGTAVNRNTAVAAYRARVPAPPLAASGATDAVYYTFKVGRVRFIVTDPCANKSPTAAVDDASKTMLGAAQKAWFKSVLTDPANAGDFFVWMAAVPWIGTSVYSWGNYTTERREIADFIKANGLVGRFCIVSGDMHSVAIDTGINTDFATGGGAPIPLFQAAPLDSLVLGPDGGPYDLGAYTRSSRQYGMMEVRDMGGKISITWTGWTGGGEKLVEHSFSYDGLPDTLGPTITTASTHTVSENRTFSLTLTADEPGATWSKVGGADAAHFTLSGGKLSMSKKDFEAPVDANRDNAYVVTVRATDAAGNATDKTITVTVSNVTGTEVNYAELVQSNIGLNAPGARTTHTVALTAPATAGNLLVVFAGFDSNIGSGLVAPAGFTQILTTLRGNNSSGALYYKVATGGEQSFSFTSTQSRVSTLAAMEWNGLTAAPFDVAASKDSTSAAVNSITVGPTAPTSQAAELALAFFTGDSTNNIFAATMRGFDGGFEQIMSHLSYSPDNGMPSLYIAKRDLSAPEAVSTTFSWAGSSADECCAFLATFKVA